ncbi:cytochrome P450 [Aeromonas veronii]|uniref:cytochrome P450 n=1 Tax=Aeromonas veronii TaxID=654 RepID=UPI00207CA9DC|nr:cytochrome P450 [Aeromonas veronii]MCO4171769.1 cytochrome P450 [Aeromonas veronii]
MHRIDTSTAQKDKFGDGKNGFTSGDAQTGVPATEVSHDILDALQEEICSVIELSGGNLSKHKNNQLYEAIENILDQVCPIGEIRIWPLPALPNNRFVYVKNQTFDKAALPKLAKIYPSGQIPFDPRGLGLRFWDDSRGMDPGRVLMSEQMDSIAAHTHNLLVKATPGGAHTVAGGTGALAAETSILGRNTVNPNDHLLIISGASGAVDGPIRPFGTTETRVKTIAPAAIMRVK